MLSEEFSIDETRRVVDEYRAICKNFLVFRRGTTIQRQIRSIESPIVQGLLHPFCYFSRE